MHTEWIDRLSDYIDDELTPGERQDVDAHLAECQPCAAALADLRANVERARTLTPVTPARDLWEGIEARIVTAATPAAAPRRFAFTMPQLLAASVLLALLSGWGALRFVRPATSPVEIADTSAPSAPPAVINAADTGDAAAVAQSVALDDAAYDRAVADLESALSKGRGHLDPVTIAVVEDNLAIIDEAVQEARQALREDPANTYLSGHFAQTRQRKLDLLRQAAALAVDTN